MCNDDDMDDQGRRRLDWENVARKMWALLLLQCPPLVVWADWCDGYDAWRVVARAHELTERRTGVVFLTLVASVIGCAVAGGGTMLGWIVMLLCGALAGWVMARPYRRTIMAVRRGLAPLAVVREAEAVARQVEAERALTEARGNGAAPPR